jgi:FtsZ-binding cell division protein ZapB
VKRVEVLELGAQFDATRDEVRRIQMEHLEQLRAIRVAMLEGGTTTSSKELEALRAENELLKQKNRKQEYRIQHLITTVDGLLASEKGA